MEYVEIIIKLVIGLSVLNVWLLRASRPTQWRGVACFHILSTPGKYWRNSYGDYDGRGRIDAYQDQRCAQVLADDFFYLN